MSADLDLAGSIRELRGIVEKIAERLLEPRRI